MGSKFKVQGELQNFEAFHNLNACTIIILHSPYFSVFVTCGALEPPDVEDDNADLSEVDSECEDAVSAKLLSKKQQVRTV